VNPINLIRPACGGNTNWFWYPVCATSEGTAQVPERRAIVRLHRAVSPTPLALSAKRHVGLELNPIRARSEDCSRREVCRESSSHLCNWDVRRTEDLSAGKSGAVGVNEDIPVGGRSGTIKVDPVSIDRLHIPRLTAGYDEVVCEISAEV